MKKKAIIERIYLMEEKVEEKEEGSYTIPGKGPFNPKIYILKNLTFRKRDQTVRAVFVSIRGVFTCCHSWGEGINNQHGED